MRLVSLFETSSAVCDRTSTTSVAISLATRIMGRLRGHGIIAASGMLVSTLLASEDLRASGPERPNIVIILADDLGIGDLGCYGGKAIPTANIDLLAAEGMRFTQAYAPSATCTPSRYAMMTGEYPWRQPPRKTSILDGDAPLAMDPTRPTLASFLKSEGYATGLVGKWHLGLGDGESPVDFNGEIRPGPLEVGFDSAFFIPATVDRVPCVFVENYRVHRLDPQDPIQVSYLRRVGSEPTGIERPDLLHYPADAQHSNVVINGISRIGSMAGGHSARWSDEDISDVLTKKADQFIAQHRERPFFLLLGAHDPHVPRLPHPRFRGKSQAGIRGDAIMQLDSLVGEVMHSLERNGIAGRTLLIFTSDNGAVLYDGYFDGSDETNGSHRPSGGLRGGKYLRYEGGTRIPLIVRWPDRTPAGSSRGELFSLHDIFASAAGLLTRELPPGAGRDGVDLSALWRGEHPPQIRDFLVQQGIGNVLALRWGKWKYLPPSGRVETGIKEQPDPRDRRFAETEVKEDLLFDLSLDPAEVNNVAGGNDGQLKMMQRLLGELQNASEDIVRKSMLVGSPAGKK